MFRSVLVPLDDSPVSARALPWALTAAAPNGAVHLLHVHEPIAPIGGEGLYDFGPSEDAARQDAEVQLLERAATAARAALPTVQVEARNVVPSGPFGEAFGEHARAVGAELVVLATHARGWIGRLVRGSAAGDVIRNVAVPVLLVRGGDAAPDLAARPAVRRVLVALEPAPPTEAIVAPAVRFAALFGAACELVTVVPETAAAEEVAAAARHLGALAEAFGPGAPKPSATVLRASGAAAGLLAHAGGDPATALALVTHARTGLNRLLRGSVAGELVRAGAGPILVLYRTDD